MPSLTRKIGSHEFAAIGFGAMSMSAFYGSVSETDEERLQLLDRVHELGCTHWDSAEVYNDSEELIGKWFERSGKRDDIFLATKFGYTPAYGSGDPAYVKEAAERSLKRLRTECIDLYYMHRTDPKIPIEETVAAMAELVKAGKVKYLGLSECSSNTLRRAHAVHPISAVQVEYSPFSLDIEDPKIGLLETARELGVKIVAYGPLGRGLLTGRYKSVDDFEEGDFRKIIPLYQDNFPQILQVVDDLKAIGARHGATTGQIALAWVLAQGDDIIPIPGTRRIKYLEENVAAQKIQLSQDEVQTVREAVKKAGLMDASARYPPGHCEVVFADTPPLKK
ncbi:Aldo/keto reductase [Gautieria morchelliformis]|nr:Aldo/keto reductase [Gautieria morchelliformis]